MSKPPRVDLWDAALRVYVATTRRDPFAWGQNDCVIWTARAVDAVLGTTIAAGVVGQYDTQNDAAAYLASLEFVTLADAAAAWVGDEVVPSYMQRGDVVFLPVAVQTDWLAGSLWVCLGERCAGVSFDGLQFAQSFTVARLRGVRAFHV